MIPQPIIDQILAIPITDALGKYVSLKKNGTTWGACCPFHQEKTPSFKVFPKTNSFKCFGCGEGGNAIGFVMRKDGITFPEACRALARDHGIHIPANKMTDEERRQLDHRESLLVVNKMAAGWFCDQLHDPANALALEYVRSRWTDETINLFDIGFAPDTWAGLIGWSEKQSIRIETLAELGLLRESEKHPGIQFDYFRGRIMFPIKDRYGRVIGFTGRDTTGLARAPKYLNTPDTEIYNKSHTLYGIHLAAQAIRDKGFVYLVEGNADVIRLHEIGIENTVCSSGTSLTGDQVKMIKGLHEKISINLIFDSDAAGVSAVHRAARMIIGEGIPCNVIRLPGDEGKADPDSFFKDHDEFTKFVNDNIQDYIIELADTWKKKANAPDFKLKAVDEICSLIIHLPESSRQLYADQVGKIIPPKKIWTDKLRELAKEMAPDEVTEQIPKHVTLSDWEKFGFYEDHNCYYFKTGKGIIRGSNFTLRPLFHIKSVSNAKRLFEITNEHGAREVIELAQKDLVALARFKECVESLGNYLWEASETELSKLKRFLYEKTDSCVEITQLGWQKHGFYAWGNGIYNGQFTPVDANGIVAHKETNYYLPAFSTIFQGEPGLFMNERKFIHRDGNPVTLQEYSDLLIRVFGDNAMIALCFYFASLFRDFIVGRFNFFPILDLFGPKGAGKTELAVSLMAFFGKQNKGPNINNTSKPALADHVAQVCNALVHIDEYKNNVDFEKIEFLKGLWDGTGRTRMNMDKDKKKETTAVDCAVVLSGQEMPTADIALFSRLVYLTFHKTEYDEEEKARFNGLKQIEKKGLSHITNLMLSYRSQFIKEYDESYRVVADDMTRILDNVVIEDRIFRNWLVILASYHAVKDQIQVAFTYEQLLKTAVNQLKLQNLETKKGNEVSAFWNIVQYLYTDGLIKEKVDFVIKGAMKVKTNMLDQQYEFPVNILYMHMGRIMTLYRKHGKLAGEKILPQDSIDYYLRNSKPYMGITNSVRFAVVHPDGRPVEVMRTDKTGIQTPTVQERVTSAYTFLYDELDITISTSDHETEENEKIPF